MANEDHTYVIKPDATDPDLIRSLAPLGDDIATPAPAQRPRSRRPRSPRVESRPVETVRPPAKPVLWLMIAFALGPFALLMTAESRRNRVRQIGTAVVVSLAVAAVWIWTCDERALGGGDRAVLCQAVAALVASAAWLVSWCLGLLSAARRCDEGPLARRGQRRPLAAGLAGFAAPGLGLLLVGRRFRCAISIMVVGAGATAGLSLWRAADWWDWHRAGSATVLNDLQLEQAFLLLIGLAGLGVLAWLVSALEAGRLAAGPRVVRAITGADRIPAAFLIALVALGFGFRPLEVSRELDGLTGTLADCGLRLAPLWTARAAAVLAPADPVLELRVAEREAALGHVQEAAAIREELQERWERFAQVDRDLARESVAAAAAADRPAASWRQESAATPFAAPDPAGGTIPSPPSPAGSGPR